MKRTISVILAIVFALVTVNAFAIGCPPGQERKGWKCVPVEQPGGATANADADARATAIAGAVGIGVGIGGDSNAKAVIQDGAVRINNRVNNDVDVKQNQGQTQGQSMAAFMGQGNVQKITIKEAKNPVAYGHISPDVGKTDAEMIDAGGDSSVRLYSSLFKYDDDSFITMAEAKKASGSADVDVVPALLWEPDVALSNLNWEDKPTGKYMGSLTLTTEDATTDQILAQACEEAMKAGATGVTIKVSKARVINGVKYGFDLGSSASVALNPDTGSAVLAPGATLGWSKAKSDNKWINEAYVELFHDATVLVD